MTSSHINVDVVSSLRGGDVMDWLKHTVFAVLGAVLLMPVTVSAQVIDIEDANITQAVERELQNDDAVASHLIDIETENGVVTLSGSVGNLLARERTVRLTGAIKGVRSIVNLIEVSPVPRTDAQIERDVKQTLQLDPVADIYEIEPAVRDGRVVLTGFVDSWPEKKLSEDIAKSVAGVRGLDNEIVVNRKADRMDHQIKSDIRAMLDSDPLVDARHIDVAVHNGDVTLSGAVGSVFEATRAIENARVAGARNIDSESLKIQWWLRETMERTTPIEVETNVEIEEAIRDALDRDPRTNEFGIEVESANGLVTLTGAVDNLKARRAAENDAENTAGVWKVKNKLKVRPINPPSDEYIRNAIENAFQRDGILEKTDITALVRNQKVYLYGTVDTGYEKGRATEVASGIFGVVAIENNIEATVRPARKSDVQIKEDLQSELFWDASIDSDDILVQVEDGVVTLTGAVDSWQQLKTAVENAFQSGAKAVKNKLNVHDRPDNIYPQEFYPYFFWGA